MSELFQQEDPVERDDPDGGRADRSPTCPTSTAPARAGHP